MRWFSDASALTRYGIETVNYGTSSGLPDPDGENLDDRRAARHRAGLRARRRRHLRGGRVKLVTFETADGGRASGPARRRRGRRHRRCPTCARCSSAALDPAAVPRASGERVALADVRLRAPIIPKKFFHTSGNFREHEDESKVVELVARDRAVDRVLPERRRDHRPRRADRLPRAPDQRARPRARAGGDHRQGRQALRRATRPRSYIAGYTIFNDITARDIQRREMRSGVFSFCKAIDTLLPARTVDRHPRRGRRPARPRHAPARQRRAAPGVALGQHVGDDPADHRPLLGARLQPRRHPLDRHGLGRRRASARTPPRCTCAPATSSSARSSGSARSRNPVISWQEAHGVPAPPLQRW